MNIIEILTKNLLTKEQIEEGYIILLSGKEGKYLSLRKKWKTGKVEWYRDVASFSHNISQKEIKDWVELDKNLHQGMEIHCRCGGQALIPPSAIYSIETESGLHVDLVYSTECILCGRTIEHRIGETHPEVSTLRATLMPWRRNDEHEDNS